MLKLKRRGQTSLEYAILIIIIAGALLAVQAYFKRGVQGRWKAVVDDLGDQYDPRVTNSRIRHSLAVNTVTTIQAIDYGTGFATRRTDITNTVDSKTGSSRTAAY